MRFALAIFGMLACATSALAQYGISNAYPQYRHESGEGYQPGPDQQRADQ